jgi:hypothetical protein
VKTICSKPDNVIDLTVLVKVGEVCMNTRKSKHNDNTYSQVSASVVFLIIFCVTSLNEKDEREPGEPHLAT